MATYKWSVPVGKEINGQTYIKETDNKIYDTISDLVDFVNAEGTHTGKGLTYDIVDKASAQTITGQKVFTNAIQGNLNGNVTGSLTGNASTATTLATSRTISLSGDVTGSISFNGGSNATMITTIVDDSHTHDSRYYTETEVNSLISGVVSGNVATASKLQTSRNIALSGAIIGNVNFDGSSSVSINTSYAISPFVPTGVIVLWSGLIANIPSGWYLCNGANGTPNLTDRFIIGAGNSYGVGTTGGSKDSIIVEHTHTASSSTNGEHTHSGVLVLESNNAEDTFGTEQRTNVGSTASAGSHNHSITVDSTGSSGINANLPPYYALAYIMKG